MADRKTEHRPLRAGVGITTSAGEPSRGTLTAIARRVIDDVRVGVTNLHIPSYGATSSYFHVDGDEWIYQGGTEVSDRVGRLYLGSWVPVQGTVIPPNHANPHIVTSTTNPCDLASFGIESEVTADLGVHIHSIGTTRHVDIPIVRGTATPIADIEVDMYGSTTGFVRGVRITSVGNEVTIRKDLDDDGTLDQAYTFNNVVRLNRSGNESMGGDSGSIGLWKDPHGNYRACVIAFGGKNTDRDQGSELQYAFPASVAERELGIYFGVEAPTAKIATPAPVYPGQWFQLNGSGSSVNEPEADPLMYEWEKVEVTAQPTPIQPILPPIGPSTSRYHNFEAPTNPGTYAYKLTVTDSNGAKHSDRVSVTVVNRPTAAPPVHPSTVSASATSNSVRISWGSVTDATGYDVQIGISGGLGHTDHPTTSTSITIASLSPLQTYEYRVRATNYLGDGPWTNWATVVTPGEIPPKPTSSQWDVRYSSNTIQVKVTSLPTVNPAISEVRAYLEAGQPPNLTTVTEAIGTSLNSWVTVLSSSDTQWQTGNWAVHIRFENSTGNSAYSDGKSATVPTSAPPPRPRPTPTPETWGPWTDTGLVRGGGRGSGGPRQKQQRRTSSLGNTQTRWVADPLP